MADSYVGVIDQGTHSTKFGIVDDSGALLVQHSEPHEVIYPRTGWVEYDAVEIWQNTAAVIDAALADLGIEGSDLEAVGITNMRETTVVWDRATGEPVRNALSWQDRRHTDRIERRREEGKAERVRELTGLELDPFFSAGKLEWALDDDETLRERGADGDVLFGTIDTWLLYNLTGVHATDVTNASRTMLFDTRELEWSDWLLSEFDVPAEMLPSVYPSSHPEAYRTTDEEGPLGAAVPVTALIGDQQAALFGHAAFDEGDVKHTIGSSSVLQMNVGTEFIENEHGLNTTVGYQIAGEEAKYALEGEIFIGGQAVEWLTEMGIVDSPADIESMARSVDSTGGAYFVPAFHGLATPYWDPTARGTIVGLDRGSGPEHLARATLEAIGYRTRDALDAMRSESGLDMEMVRLDGGMSQNRFVCEFIADLAQSRIEIPDETETTSMGAAFAAGLAVDVWSDLDEVRAHRRVASRIDPSGPVEELERRYDDWQRAVSWSRDWNPVADHGD